MEQGRRENLRVAREPAVLVVCLLPDNQNDPHDPLGELRALADTAGAVVRDELIQNRQRPNAATFIGKGKLHQLALIVESQKAKVVIFDNELTPSQIAKIEQSTACKVLDRSELILDIFAARARTYEAKLQVELAQLEYTYPRLRSMWSHLERIVGGTPTGIGTRGPGEQQLEVDRRIVMRKKTDLKRQIARIQGRKRREVQARNRDFFTVGLVGYTNAGKSTLFNALTEPSGGGGAYTDDKLFATLSTRTRRWKMGAGDTVMLSDTVGFVRELPHHLIASFRATLEESIHSDLLLIVLDISNPRAEPQLETVLQALNEIEATQQQRIVALNKIDLLEHNADLLLMQTQWPKAIPISAMTGRGINVLFERVRQAMCGPVRRMQLEVDQSDAKLIHFIESLTDVLDRQYNADNTTFTVHVGTHQLDQLRAMGRGLRVIKTDDPPPTTDRTKITGHEDKHQP